MRAVLAAFVVLAVAIPATALGSPGASAARLHRCHTRADATIVISSSRDMTCGAARREIRRHRGSISRRFNTPAGFHCRRVSGNRLAGQWRCHTRRRAFRFEFSD